MQPLSRVTPATVDVLTCLIGSADATWGLLIIRDSGRPAGTVYPVLERLERSGWVESEWDDDDTRTGPRRRMYRLTSDGAEAARATVRDYAARTSKVRTVEA